MYHFGSITNAHIFNDIGSVEGYILQYVGRPATTVNNEHGLVDQSIFHRLVGYCVVRGNLGGALLANRTSYE